MSTVTQARLRRYAQRSLGVLARHRESAACIAAFDDSLAISATTYIEAFDAAQSAQASRSRTIDKREGAADELRIKIRGWMAHVRRDVTGARGKSFGKSRVAEDVIADVGAIVALIEGHIADGGKELTYFESLKADLELAVEACEADLESAGTSAAKVTQLQTAARESAERFWDDLVAFRFALRAIIGSAHPDYRKLRVISTNPAEDEEETAPDSEASASSSLTMDVGGIADEPLVLKDPEDGETHEVQSDEVAAAE